MLPGRTDRGRRSRVVVMLAPQAWQYFVAQSLNSSAGPEVGLCEISYSMGIVLYRVQVSALIWHYFVLILIQGGP